MKKALLTVVMVAMASVAVAQQEVFDIKQTVIPAVPEQVKYEIPTRQFTVYVNAGETIGDSEVLDAFLNTPVPQGTALKIVIKAVTEVETEQFDPKPEDSVVAVVNRFPGLRR